MYRALGIGIILFGFTNFAYSFVTANTVWLYVVVRLLQHVLGVLHSGVISTILYDHLPLTDRTNYLSFYSIVQNASIFLALMLDTALAALMKNDAIHVLGFSRTSTQIMLFVGGLVLIFGGILSITWAHKLMRFKP
jgi:MFS family permease